MSSRDDLVTDLVPLPPGAVGTFVAIGQVRVNQPTRSRKDSPPLYDMILLKRADGNYDLHIKVTVFYDFQPGPNERGDEVLQWGGAREKIAFIKGFEQRAQKTWNSAVVATLIDGHKVFLVVNIDSRYGPRGNAKGAAYAYASVVKTDHDIRSSGGYATLHLDSRDGLSTAGRNPKTPGHEIGHIFNNADEYVPASRYYSDKSSVMNEGTEIRPRHLAEMRAWVLSKLGR